MSRHWDHSDVATEVWVLNSDSIPQYIRELTSSGVLVRSIGNRPREKLQFRLPAWLKRDAVKNDICVVHSHTPYPLAIVTIARCFLGARFRHVHHQHGLATDEQKWLWRVLGKVGAPDRVIAVSGWVRDRLIDDFPFLRDRIVVVHNGVEPPDRELVRPITRTRELFAASRLVPFKNMGLLLDAFAIARADCSDIRLTVLGDGIQRDDLERKAKALGMDCCVSFRGYVLEPEQYFRDLDIFVLPSLYEPFGLSLLEAMSWGRACIATSVGGTAEFMDDNQNGLLVSAVDPKEMAQAILKLANDLSLAQRLGMNGRQTSERLTVSATVSQIQEVYRGLV